RRSTRSTPGSGSRTLPGCSSPGTLGSTAESAAAGEVTRGLARSTACVTLGRMTDTLQEAPTAVKPINHWIGGMSVAGSSGRSGAVYNPATGRQTGQVDFASTEEVQRAVAAAKAAFPVWRATSLSKRADLFFRIRALF